MVVITGAVLVVIDRALVTVPPTLSVTPTVKLYVPTVVGVPEIVPDNELSHRPVGRYPADVDQV